MSDPNALVVLPASAVDALVRSACADVAARLLETHAAEVRELRGLLVYQKPLLTAAEAGMYLLGGVTDETVMTYVREAGLPCHKPGRAPLFVPAEVLAWVTARSDAPASVMAAPG